MENLFVSLNMSTGFSNEETRDSYSHESLYVASDTSTSSKSSTLNENFLPSISRYFTRMSAIFVFTFSTEDRIDRMTEFLASDTYIEIKDIIVTYPI
jgi:hypothetical protein